MRKSINPNTILSICLIYTIAYSWTLLLSVKVTSFRIATNTKDDVKKGDQGYGTTLEDWFKRRDYANSGEDEECL